MGRGKGWSRLPDGEASFRSVLYEYKRRAKRRNLLFELSEEQFRALTKGDCFYCGASPSAEAKTVRKTGSYIYNGIDRLDSSKGYVLGNCVSCCSIHNYMKQELPFTEFINACQAVVKKFSIAV